jgi:UPF0716 family protein affecting phage T7 exclusion
MRVIPAGLVTFAVLAAVAAVGACEERSFEARSVNAPDRTSGASLGIRVVDDPVGAVRVVAPGSRPTVTLIFALDVTGVAAVRATGVDQVVIQVPVDSSAGGVVAVGAALPPGHFDGARLVLASATLAIPGEVRVTDLLGGARGIAITRRIALDLRRGLPATVTIELNSGRWLSAVRDPLPGEPAYRFNGASAFLDAIDIITR